MKNLRTAVFRNGTADARRSGVAVSQVISNLLSLRPSSSREFSAFTSVGNEPRVNSRPVKNKKKWCSFGVIGIKVTRSHNGSTNVIFLECTFLVGSPVCLWEYFVGLGSQPHRVLLSVFSSLLSSPFPATEVRFGVWKCMVNESCSMIWRITVVILFENPALFQDGLSREDDNDPLETPKSREILSPFDDVNTRQNNSLSITTLRSLLKRGEISFMW